MSELAKKILKKFPNIMSHVKDNISKSKDFNLSKTTKTSPFHLYFDMGAQFIQKGKDGKLPKKIQETIDNLGIEISEEVPEQFKEHAREPGIYTYGNASTPTLDAEGESIIIPDEILEGVTTGRYNKIFNGHNHADMASGVIKFAGKVGENSVILERMNEHHKDFENSVGSVHNGSVDSYSVDGKATFSTGANGEIVRTFTKLDEVSRLSFPSNPDAGIAGMFIVKMAKGGYQTREVFNMDSELKEALGGIQKTLDDHSAKFADQGKRIDSFETFQKGLEDAAIKKDGEDSDADKEAAEKAEAEKKAADKEAADKADGDKPDGDKPDGDKPDADAEKSAEEKVEKMIQDKVDERLSKILQPKKSVHKSEEISKAKGKSTDKMLEFLGDSSKLKLNAKGGN